MKYWLRGLEVPFCIAVGMALASLLIGRNIFAEPPLLAVIGSYLLFWVVGYLRERYRNRRKAR